MKIKGISPSNKIEESLCALKDGVNKFNEIESGKGILGRFQGSEIMSIIKNYKKVIEKLIN